MPMINLVEYCKVNRHLKLKPRSMSSQLPPISVGAYMRHDRCVLLANSHDIAFFVEMCAFAPKTQLSLPYTCYGIGESKMSYHICNYVRRT